MQLTRCHTRGMTYEHISAGCSVSFNKYNHEHKAVHTAYLTKALQSLSLQRMEVVYTTY